MKKLYLITSNPWKVESFTAILKQYNLPVEIEMLSAEYVEDKELWTTQWVVLTWAKACAEKYNVPVIVQDTGIFVKALNWFPWVNTKFAIKTIGNEGIVKLLEWIEDRSCVRDFALGYCEPWKDPVVFSGTVSWSISTELLGDNGFGFDPIFIPDGYETTFAQDTAVRDSLSPFNNTIQELVAHVTEW